MKIVIKTAKQHIVTFIIIKLSLLFMNIISEIADLSKHILKND